MTDTQRWRLIAQEFEGPNTYLTDDGLCFAWEDLGGVYSEIDAAMVQWKKPGHLYLCPRPPRGRKMRATFAALMAAMTKRERREIGMP